MGISRLRSLATGADSAILEKEHYKTPARKQKMKQLTSNNINKMESESLYNKLRRPEKGFKLFPNLPNAFERFVRKEVSQMNHKLRLRFGFGAKYTVEHHDMWARFIVYNDISGLISHCVTLKTMDSHEISPTYSPVPLTPEASPKRSFPKRLELYVPKEDEMTLDDWKEYTNQELAESFDSGVIPEDHPALVYLIKGASVPSGMDLVAFNAYDVLRPLVGPYIGRVNKYLIYNLEYEEYLTETFPLSKDKEKHYLKIVLDYLKSQGCLP